MRKLLTRKEFKSCRVNIRRNESPQIAMTQNNSIKIFISYAHKDERYKDKLLTFLAPLKAKGLLSYWEASQLLIGTDFTKEILVKLNEAELFLLLLSPDAIASEFINKIELSLAHARYEQGGIIIVPIIVRPCNWETLNLNHLHAAPIGGKPITLWENEDLAFKNVTEQIEKLVRSLLINAREENKADLSLEQPPTSLLSTSINIGSINESPVNISSNASINQTFNFNKKRKNNNKKSKK